MEKFPEDVIIAEKRTDGNENILDDAKFAVQKKEVKISEIFGSPKVKNSPKLGPGGRPKGSTCFLITYLLRLTECIIIY